MRPAIGGAPPAPPAPAEARRGHPAWRRWPRPARLDAWLDVALAAVLLVLDLLLFSDLLSRESVAATGRGTLPWTVVVPYAAAGFAVLAWGRRRAPLPVFAVLLAHAVLALSLPAAGYRPTLGLLAALYGLAVRAPLRVSLTALLATAVPIALAAIDELRVTPRPLHGETLVGFAVVYGLVHAAVWGVGRWAGATRRRTEELERRRREAARRAVVAERARIARELHDIVSHAVTIMILQAAGARGLVRSDPGRAEQALGDIHGVGEQAMGELRRLLGVLRAGGAGEEPGTGDPGAGLAAPAGLAGLDDLVSAVRGAGVPVRIEVDGEAGRLDRSVDLAAYRVVQEALTNVGKHAGDGAAAAVRLRWAGDLAVEVSDTGGGPGGRAAAGLSTGHGIAGLRERVQLVGGTLDAGPSPSGGFAVSARLPLAGPAAPAGVLGGDDRDGGERDRDEDRPGGDRGEGARRDGDGDGENVEGEGVRR